MAASADRPKETTTDLLGDCSGRIVVAMTDPMGHSVSGGCR
jgi:hypothetical protein